jgi:RNA recognition motif-containing protein
MDRVTGRSRGFGFVQFSQAQDAENALAGMDGKVGGCSTPVALALVL